LQAIYWDLVLVAVTSGLLKTAQYSQVLFDKLQRQLKIELARLALQTE